MINYLNTAIVIYVIITSGLFLYLHRLSEENVKNNNATKLHSNIDTQTNSLQNTENFLRRIKIKLWFVLFFYFASCMFILQMAVTNR